MGLFSKEEKKQETVTPPPERKNVKNEKDPIESVLAKEMVITGEVNFKGKARFDGRIEGDITGEYLILSETAKVTGNIEVATLVCHGRVKGNITADIVTVHATSAICGILQSENLTVESGATLEGEIHASTRKQAPTTIRLEEDESKTTAGFSSAKKK